MTLHLIKLCVGVEDVDHLSRLQAGRLADARRRGEAPELKHLTRNAPRQVDEVLAGGSIYWVIRGLIRVRQRIVAIRRVKRDDGRPACALVLDPALVRTEIRGFRAFQGWRYLAPADAPGDAPPSKGAAGDVPAEMAAELKGLGLL